MSELHQQDLGVEAPYWPVGPFKVRLPFIHYRFEISDYMQGLLMCAVDLAAIPLMTEFLGMPFSGAGGGHTQWPALPHSPLAG